VHPLLQLFTRCIIVQSGAVVPTTGSSTLRHVAKQRCRHTAE